MQVEIQRSIDALGEQLKRSVVINDPDLKLIYSSQHYGDEDPVRIRGVLHRDAGSEVIGHLLNFGVASWTKSGRVPESPDLDLFARFVVPIRWHGELLGYVMVIDQESTLTSEETRTVEHFGTEVAGLMVAERHAADQRALADSEGVVAWLGRDAALRVEGMRDLVTRGLLPDLPHIRVLAVEVDGDSSPSSFDTRIDLALRHAFKVLDGRVHGSVLTAVRRGRGVAAILTPVSLTRDQVTGLVQLILQETQAAAQQRTVHVGVGTPVTNLDEAWQSRRQADLAADAAPLLDEGPVAWWDDIGVFQILMRIPPEELDETAVPSAISALIEKDPHGFLLETLESYLRHGGASTAAAAQLNLHRTTVYYRLDRIRDITGVDIDDGQTRLSLHLGLLMHRLLTGDRDLV